jgi:hypothetical protein
MIAFATMPGVYAAPAILRNQLAALCLARQQARRHGGGSEHTPEQTLSAFLRSSPVLFGQSRLHRRAVGGRHGINREIVAALTL